MNKNQNQLEEKKNHKTRTKREILKKINIINSRIEKNERELKQIELQYKKKKDFIVVLKKDFEIELELMQEAPAKFNVAKEHSNA